MPAARLQIEHTALLVVDMQERLLPAMAEPDTLVTQVGRLIDGAHVLEVPVIVTEQYRKGLGPTVPELDKRLSNAVCRQEKLKFSACIEPVRDELMRRGVRAVVVCGIEAHVCVLQTCLDLLDAGLVPFVVLDAVGSRRDPDRDAAVTRMTQAGVIATTVESALLELVHEAGTERFKAILPLIK